MKVQFTHNLSLIALVIALVCSPALGASPNADEWEDRDKITKYLKSDDFMKLFSAIDILCFKTPEVKFHTVSDSAGIEFIESVLEN